MKLVDIMAYGKIDIIVENTKDWYTVNITNVTEDTISVELPQSMKNFNVGDEVNCRFQDEEEIYIFDGEICDVVFKYPQEIVIFAPGQIKRYGKSKREKRYNVGIMAEIYKLRKFYGYVQNISKAGICIHSQHFLEKGDAVGITLYLDKKKTSLYFEGRVVRKKEIQNYREYGIEIESIREENEQRYIELLDEVAQNDLTQEYK